MKIFNFIVDGNGTFPTTIEFYMLQPKDYFEGFGGSRHGLVVQKTASIISRIKGPVDGWKDTEWDAKDPQVWSWIHRLMTLPNTVETLSTAKPAEAAA